MVNGDDVEGFVKSARRGWIEGDSGCGEGELKNDFDGEFFLAPKTGFHSFLSEIRGTTSVACSQTE